MFVAALRKLIGRIWPATTESGAIALQASSEPKRGTAEQADVALGYSPTAMVAYDENLLERSRTQWQFGDWASLAKLDRDTLQHHPDRAKLALLAAAGHQGIGNAVEARQLARLAIDWGCSKKLVSQILISGVHNTLGRAAATCSQPARALKHFGNAIKIGNPDGETTLLTQARATYQVQPLRLPPFTTAPGIESVDTGLAAEPISSTSPTKPQRTPAERAAYLNKTGENLYKSGNYKIAVEYFQRALNLQPQNAWICQNLAEATARLDYKKEDAWECEELAGSIEETGKWDVVVRHYRKALKLDFAQVQAHRAAQTFKVESPQDDHIESPIFIVGCGHSGTSLLLAIIGSHPRIHAIPKESALFLRTDAAVQKTMRQWDADCAATEKRRWAEKTPPHVFQIHRLLAFRPKARFILILRDGRDVVCSLKYRIGYAALEDRLERWIYDNMAALPYLKHPQLKVIKYENLVVNPEETLRTICIFLGEEYATEMLDYHKIEHRWYSEKIDKPDFIKTHEDHVNNRNWQINQPIFDGRGRWCTEMIPAEQRQFKMSRAQALLEQFGYVDNSDW
jgi:tetratricopeptide (TPR) repeat protein